MDIIHILKLANVLEIWIQRIKKSSNEQHKRVVCTFTVGYLQGILNGILN